MNSKWYWFIGGIFFGQFLVGVLDELDREGKL